MFEYSAESGDFLVCEETLAERADVLVREKFRGYFPHEDEVLEYLDQYEAMSERVQLTERVVACRDPRDDVFLSLAVSGNADCIVAGDADLTDMGVFRGIPIHTPAQFLQSVMR
ncbi:putative toxin-antitoxin system toxin component, PIN family [Azospirillum sp. ST 5-10]|uniref:putative toxin-antitoxin system toxin component, PIN family n=1 Tax=unclassified Azospirillum TaxID=2630922 RepID=UPI003F49DA90